ncbi:hypothetical protein L484_019135 [Morus notabilis]|uniref:Uncharacterized protein n=1 Tax=Morus notabilis TaxID=981085 RepID=W9SJA2_9ROSA|nr:hypothetical protein L484_019135 [Morus notabilis]
MCGIDEGDWTHNRGSFKIERVHAAKVLAMSLSSCRKGASQWVLCGGGIVLATLRGLACTEEEVEAL